VRARKLRPPVAYKIMLGLLLVVIFTQLQFIAKSFKKTKAKISKFFEMWFILTIFCVFLTVREASAIR
jgi:hypothetical protein